MFSRANSRSVATALVVMMAVVLIAIPTCTMIGCDMGMGQGMPYMPSGTGIFNACPGEWTTTNGGPAGILPNTLNTIVFSLGALVVAVGVLLAPRRTASLVRVLASDPPPPPEDPLGQRTRI